MRLNIGTLIRVKSEQFINLFIETFENGWFFLNNYVSILFEEFEDWGLGDFITLFTETFTQQMWFIDNLFGNLFSDNFENWFIQNNYNFQFTENFEGVW